MYKPEKYGKSNRKMENKSRKKTARLSEKCTQDERKKKKNGRKTEKYAKK
jgi:hypothetical protein